MNKSKLGVLVLLAVVSVVVSGCLPKNTKDSVGKSSDSKVTKVPNVPQKNENNNQQSDDKVVEEVKKSKDTSESAIDADLGKIEKELDLDLNLDDLK